MRAHSSSITLHLYIKSKIQQESTQLILSALVNIYEYYTRRASDLCQLDHQLDEYFILSHLKNIRKIHYLNFDKTTFTLISTRLGLSPIRILLQYTHIYLYRASFTDNYLRNPARFTLSSYLSSSDLAYYPSCSRAYHVSAVPFSSSQSTQ